MGVRSETLRDIAIVESRLARRLAFAGRLGGIAVTGCASYWLTRSGSAPDLAMLVSGIGAIGSGVRLRRERSAAIASLAPFEDDGEVAVIAPDRHKTAPIVRHANIGTVFGPTLEVIGAGLLGLERGIDAMTHGEFSTAPEAVTAAVIAAGIVWTEMSIRRAGPIHTEPRLHQLLHLVPGGGESAQRPTDPS